jgi:hypothetical protein
MKVLAVTGLRGYVIHIAADVFRHKRIEQRPTGLALESENGFKEPRSNFREW